MCSSSHTYVSLYISITTRRDVAWSHRLESSETPSYKLAPWRDATSNSDVTVDVSIWVPTMFHDGDGGGVPVIVLPLLLQWRRP